MPDEITITCPVCRANQPAQPTCRRCRADLTLLVKAVRSLHRARQDYDEAQRAGDSQRAARTLQYLKWLNP
jgi:hypothetical protein